MNNLSNHSNYITGLKKDGLHKADMIDYITGIYNNMATRNDILVFCMRYISPKDPAKIVNEIDLRRLLRKSNIKVIKELFFLAKERYSHVSRYRDDKLDQNDKALSQLKKENFDSFEMGDNDYTSNIQDMSNDLVDRLGDVATHLQDLVSSDQLNLSQDHLDAISQLEKSTLLENVNSSNILETLNVLSSIKDNKTKLLVLRAKMFIK